MKYKNFDCNMFMDKKLSWEKRVAIVFLMYRGIITITNILQLTNIRVTIIKSLKLV